LLGETPQGKREAAWWGRARSVIERWNPGRSAEAKAAADLFFANFQSVGKGASERHRGQLQMDSLLNQAKHDLPIGELRPGGASPKQSVDSALIADSRLVELRGLVSPDFDFRKLIRLCEELNTAY
jgi:hypothetical protein